MYTPKMICTHDNQDYDVFFDVMHVKILSCHS